MFFSKRKSTPLYDPFSHSVFREQPQRAPIKQQSRIPMSIYGAIIVPFFLGVGVTLVLTESNQSAEIAEATQQPAATQATAAAQQPALEEIDSLVSANVQQDVVTRNSSVDLMFPVQPSAEVLAELRPQTPTDRPAAPVSEAELVEAAAEISVEQEVNSQQIADLQMQLLKSAAISGNYDVKVGKSNGKWQLMLHPVNLDMDRKELETLLAFAEERGEVSFPNGASIAEGDVDLDVALFNYVQSALISDGTDESIGAAQEMSQRAFLAIAESEATVRE